MYVVVCMYISQNIKQFMHVRISQLVHSYDDDILQLFALTFWTHVYT